MTCREKLQQEHPEKVIWGGVCIGCPYDYNYADKLYYCDGGDENCTDCWDREVEGAEEKEMKKEFTYADLQDGMVVQLRNKLCFLVVKRNDQMRMVAEGGYYKGQDLTDNLKSRLLLAETKHDLDVMKVFEAAPLEEVANISQLIKNKGKLLWERREEMTIEEVEKELGYKIKIVAPPTEK